MLQIHKPYKNPAFVRERKLLTLAQNVLPYSNPIRYTMKNPIAAHYL